MQSRASVDYAGKFGPSVGCHQGIDASATHIVAHAWHLASGYL